MQIICSAETPGDLRCVRAHVGKQVTRKEVQKEAVPDVNTYTEAMESNKCKYRRHLMSGSTTEGSRP